MKKILTCLALVITSVTATATPLSNLPSRDIDQIRSEMEKARVRDQIKRMEENLQKEKNETPKKTQPSTKSSFTFTLKTILHTPSSVLSDDEFNDIVKPWIGKNVTNEDLKALINAINSYYQDKGYVVCKATILPQRIVDGVLTVTLIEGKTDKTTVKGAKTTRENFIKNAFHLQTGEVANYAEMVEDLVRFNMTHDVQLHIDIKPGEKTGTTSYDIYVNEPDLLNFSIFADSLGSRQTGRPRIGTALSYNSLMGIRDAVNIIAIKSEGSETGYISYSIPLNALGTRATISASKGKVDVVNTSAADFGITGDSERYELRFDHPIFVTSKAKITPYLNFSHEKSSTDMFKTISTNDSEINTNTIGIENIFLANSGSTAYLNLSLSKHRAKNEVFDTLSEYYFFNGDTYLTFVLTPQITASFSGAWQTHIGGGQPINSDFFYLGHTSGVRGYDNDVLSGKNGFWQNTQLAYRFAETNISLFGFFDYGHVSGESIYEHHDLASIGTGIDIPLWSNAKLTASASHPLVRHENEIGPIDNLRLDFAFVSTW